MPINLFADLDYIPTTPPLYLVFRTEQQSDSEYKQFSSIRDGLAYIKENSGTFYACFSYEQHAKVMCIMLNADGPL